MVLALASLRRIPHYLRHLNGENIFISIICPTLGRSESLRACLESLEKQTYRNFEVIQVIEEGELAKLRNEGAKRARGDVFTFIDDDVVCSPTWLEGIVEAFSNGDFIGGVSGPSIVDFFHRSNRDIFRFKLIKKIYDWVFLDGIENLPGHITRAGTWTTGACNEDCSYEGYVQYLEACNMSFTREAFEKTGGFDESFKGVGDWSEPDLAFRVTKAGYRLWFSRKAALRHNPSRSGAFRKRIGDSKNRLSNYVLFSDRHVSPSWRNSLYKAFLRSYYEVKGIERFFAH